MSFTYDLTQPSGLVRLLTTDTDSTNFLFNDLEIAAFLTICQNNVTNAAATAYETLARDRAKLMKATEQGGFKSEMHASEEFLALAASIRNAALSGLLQTGDIGADDTYLDNFRPRWREVDDPPVVE